MDYNHHIGVKKILLSRIEVYYSLKRTLFTDALFCICQPFDDKDSGDEDSDDNDNDDGDSDKEGAYKRILSPPRDYDKGISLGSSVTQSTPLDPERPVSR